MKRFMLTVALTCVLAASTLAGDIPSVGSSSPSPQGMTQTTSTTSPGEIPTVGLTEQLPSATLSALLTVLGLLAI